MGVVETPRYKQRTVAARARLDAAALHRRARREADASRSTRASTGCERRRVDAGAGDDVEVLCERILRTLAGDAQDDDVTMIALHALVRLEDRVAIQVAGDPGALTATRETLRRWLLEAGADAIETHDITMACNEACQNAIEHAYELGADLFDVMLERSGAEVSITIRDRGSWKTGSSPDRGRGLELMRELMDAVEVDGGDGGSTVSLQRTLAAPLSNGAVPVVR